MFKLISRRALTLAFATGLAASILPAYADDADTSKDAILNDPATPASGNKKGDLTIVVFFDYNCPYCKMAEPDLERMVKADGKIKLVYKEWPILTEASVKGSQWALAARYQGKYDVAHRALMAIPGHKITADQMREAISNAGVDMTRLDADLTAHADEIEAMLKRNLAQANYLGLQGTPAYIVGVYRVTSALNYDGFKKVAADARARMSKN